MVPFHLQFKFGELEVIGDGGGGGSYLASIAYERGLWRLIGPKDAWFLPDYIVEEWYCVWLWCTYVCTFVHSFVRLFVCSFVRTFVRSFPHTTAGI